MNHQKTNYSIEVEVNSDKSHAFLALTEDLHLWWGKRVKGLLKMMDNLE